MASSSGLKILSVDDSKSVHSYIQGCFAGKNVELTHIYSGDELLKFIGGQAQGLSGIDVILMDWEMPGLTGPEIVDQLNKLGVKTPVIMLTSRNDPNDLMVMLGKGVREYVMKPFTQDILFQKIEMVIGRSV